MRQKIISGRGLFILILIIVTVSLVLILIYKESQPKINQPSVTPATGISQEDLIANYQNQSFQIFNQYLTRQQSLPLTSELTAEQQQQWINFLQQLKADLLELRVPGQYRDLHLQLVFNFDVLEKGLLTDQSTISEAQLKIEKLAVDYPWLLSK